MSLMASRTHLATLSRELARNWDYTSEHWQDQRRAEFEVKYLEPLRTQLVASMDAREKLDRILLKIRSDCE